MNRDIIYLIISFLSSIEKRYKVAFYFASVITALVFSIFITQFLLNNHGMRLPWVNPFEQFNNGRWFTAVFFSIFYNADIPVLKPLITVLVSVISGLLVIVTLWNGKKIQDAFKLGIITMVISLYPAMLSSYYYTWHSEIFVFASFFSILGLYVASKLQIWRIVVGSILIMFALATYQTSLSIIATVFFGFFIIQVTEHKSGIGQFWERGKQVLLSKFIVIIFGGILYRLSLPIFSINMGNSHATKTIAFSDIFSRFIQVVSESFKALTYTQPELMYVVKYLLLAATIAAAFALIYAGVRNSRYMHHKIFKTAILIVLFFCMVVSTKAMFLISNDNNFWIYRYNFSLAYFYGFVFCVLFLYGKRIILQNVIVIACILVVSIFAQANLVRQGVMLRGQQHDLALANRILFRIESLPDLDLTKEYFLVRTGNYSNFRIDALMSKGHSFDYGGDSHMDNGDITAVWAPADVMSLLGSKISWKGIGYMPDYQEKMQKGREIAEKQGRKPWPHPTSVFIYNDWIIIYM